MHDLVPSNFSFSHSVLKTLVLQTRKEMGCLAKNKRTMTSFGPRQAAQTDSVDTFPRSISLPFYKRLANMYFALKNLKHFMRRKKFSLFQIDSICRQQFHSKFFLTE